MSRGDLLAVLQNGFGKSLIFQVLVRVKEILTGNTSVVIVVCPLKSIVQDQIAEASSMGLTAVSLADNRLEYIVKGNFNYSLTRRVRDRGSSSFTGLTCTVIRLQDCKTTGATVLLV